MQINASFLTGLTGSLNQLTDNEQALTNELSSGVRVNALSDDPVAAARNVELSASIQQDVSYQQASSTANSVLQVTDSALGSVVSQLTQAISAATQGVNGTQNSGDTTTVVTQLSGIRDEVLSLANTTFQGTYLFAGSKGTTQPFVLTSSTNPATVTYQGDTETSSLVAPDGSSVAVSTPGNQVFSQPGSDVLGTLNQLISDFSSGNIAQAQSLTTSLTGLVAHVSTQRAGVDDSINRITSEQGALQAQSTQLTAEQTSLMQADPAQIATSLSSTETQQTALEDVLATLEKQGSLFNVIAG